MVLGFELKPSHLRIQLLSTEPLPQPPAVELWSLLLRAAPAECLLSPRLSDLLGIGLEQDTKANKDLKQIYPSPLGQVTRAGHVCPPQLEVELPSMAVPGVL